MSLMTIYNNIMGLGRRRLPAPMSVSNQTVMPMPFKKFARLYQRLAQQRAPKQGYAARPRDLIILSGCKKFCD